jgi:hypothetical protein
MLSLLLPEYLGSKHDMIFLDPPSKEMDEHVENCQEDGALRPWSMVMSGPHDIDKFSKLTYILPCHCGPYHDRIADWLEDSYIKSFQGNGKFMLDLFLNDDYKGKYDVFVSYFDALPFLLLMFDFVFVAGLEFPRWLHWKCDYT